MQPSTAPHLRLPNGSLSGAGNHRACARPGHGGVLVFLHGFGPGGVERIALRLVRGWRQDGMAVDLLLGSDSGPMRDELGADAQFELSPAWPLIGRGLKTLRLTVAAVQAVRTRRPDILFCAGNVYTIVAIVLKLALGRNCPIILAKISNDLIRRDMPLPLRPLYSVWLRIQGLLIDQFAALSEPMAAEVACRMGVSASRVHVLPNPVLTLAEIDHEAPRPAFGAGRRFVAIGRLERQKNYPLMLRAFASGRGQDDTLAIYGEGSERRELESLVRKLGIGEQVHFAGFSADIRKVLSAHDVLLLSSRYEGQPGAVIEALSCGLAIVATRCCASMASLLDDGALGRLVDPADEAAFAQAIQAARADAQEPVRSRAKARAFTIERAVPAYRQLFARILPAALREARPTSLDADDLMKASFS